MAEDWQSAFFRQSIVVKINDAIAASSLTPTRNGTEMENHVFMKARSKEEYLGFVAKLIIHVRDSKNKQQQQQQQQQQQPNSDVNNAGGSGNNSGGMQDPINALQNLASQGSRPMPQQMMSLGGGGQMNPMNAGMVGPGVVGQPGNNTNVLQSLIHSRPGQQQQQQQPMQRLHTDPHGKYIQPLPNNMQQQQQQGNMAAGGMVNNNMQMGMGPMGQQQAQQQMNQMGGQMPMGGNMNVPNQQMISINPGMGQNQMNVGLNAQQMNQNQMSQILGGRINVGPGGMANQGVVGGGMVGQQMGQMNPNGMPQQMNPNVVAGNMGPQQQQQQQQQQMGQNVINSQMPINQPNMVGQNPMGGAGQMNLSQMLNIQQHMGRKQDMMMNNPSMYQVRNQYLPKSPSPSAQSPANMGGVGGGAGGVGAGQSYQGQGMVPSPALVPSPQMPNIMSQQRNSVMAPSPSSSINTPGQAQAVPSPLNPHEEQQYREKYRQLTKYIEPLKRMVARIGNDGKDSNEKLLKMNKLLEILCNPNKRIPLDTLLKCEIALEKMDFKTYLFAPSSGGAQFGNLKEHQINNPLLEAVNANLQSPIGNHTLQRTFRPCLEALFGPDIKNLPPPSKQQKMSSADDMTPVVSSTTLEIPHILQGEIARLDQKFKVSLDPSSQIGTRIIKLVCCLDDKYLPCVPPVSVVIPDDYPSTAPSCKLIEQEYNATPFLISVQCALVARISKLPKQFSLSHLLDTWEMSVRQACSPALIKPTTTSVIMGI